jgi:PPOX class probable F420-dependent enzyme
VSDSIEASVPESHRDLLASPLTAVLTTIGPTGHPQSTAVWYLVEDGVLKTSVLSSRQKYSNMVRTPKATLFIMDPANPFRTLEIRADIELSADPAKTLLPKFAARYHVDIAMLDQPGDRMNVDFNITHVVAFG